MNKLTIKLVASVVASVVCVFLLSGVSFAASGGFGGRPANPDPKVPRSKDIFIYTLKADDSKKDAVLISNNSDETQTIEFYSTDASISNTGAFACKQQVDPRKDVGSWIKLEKNEVTLKPGTHTEVPFTITAPHKAEPGEHDGCLAFQSKDDGGHVEGNVRIRTRSAVRVAVTIPGDLHRNIDITSFTVSNNENGQQQFALSVKNTGNVSADTRTSITLSTLLGMTVYHNEGVYPVIAGNKYDVNFTNDKKPFWGGWYKATADIAYQEEPGTFGVKDDSKQIKKDAPIRYVFVVPDMAATIIYFVGILLLCGSSFYWLYRRRELSDALRNWGNYTVKQGDTIQTISETYGISWKKLAKVNNVRPPYTLTEGDSLRIPKKIKRS